MQRTGGLQTTDPLVIDYNLRNVISPVVAAITCACVVYVSISMKTVVRLESFLPPSSFSQSSRWSLAWYLGGLWCGFGGGQSLGWWCLESSQGCSHRYLDGL